MREDLDLKSNGRQRPDRRLPPPADHDGSGPSPGVVNTVNGRGRRAAGSISWRESTRGTSSRSVSWAPPALRPDRPVRCAA